MTGGVAGGDDDDIPEDDIDEEVHAPAEADDEDVAPFNELTRSDGAGGRASRCAVYVCACVDIASASVRL